MDDDSDLPNPKPKPQKLYRVEAKRMLAAQVENETLVSVVLVDDEQAPNIVIGRKIEVSVNGTVGVGTVKDTASAGSLGVIVFFRGELTPA